MVHNLAIGNFLLLDIICKEENLKAFSKMFKLINGDEFIERVPVFINRELQIAALTVVKKYTSVGLSYRRDITINSSRMALTIRRKLV